MRAVCALGDPRPHPQRTARRRCVRTQEDAERAIQTMNGMVVGQWRVRCGWANHKQARPPSWAQPLGTARLLSVRRSMCRHEAAARSLQAWCAAGAWGMLHLSGNGPADLGRRRAGDGGRHGRRERGQGGPHQCKRVCRQPVGRGAGPGGPALRAPAAAASGWGQPRACGCPAATSCSLPSIL